MNEELIRKIVSEVIDKQLVQEDDTPSPVCRQGFEIPVEASGRHVHLCEADIERLFGKGYRLTEKKSISQPGQYLCEERVTIIGPKNVYQHVAVLGPPREKTQVEISMTDARFLGVDAPVALSGDLKDAADITIASDRGAIVAPKCCIVARNHIHMAPEDAQRAGLRDGDLVDVAMVTDRPVTMNNVVIRSGPTHKLAMHIDFDEVNACWFKKGSRGVILGKSGAGICCSVQAENSSGEGETPQKTDTVTLDKKFITERELKEIVENGASAVIVGKGSILSALAKDFLSQNHVALKYQ